MSLRWLSLSAASGRGIGSAKPDCYCPFMGVGKSLENAEETSNFIVGLLNAAIAHPYAFTAVIFAIAFVLCFLPNGVVKQWIVHRTEMRKLDERVDMSRKKLTSGRQNRRK